MLGEMLAWPCLQHAPLPRCWPPGPRRAAALRRPPGGHATPAGAMPAAGRSATPRLQHPALCRPPRQVMPFSTACSTPLSNFEAGLNYKDVSDPAVMVAFPIRWASWPGAWAGAGRAGPAAQLAAVAVAAVAGLAGLAAPAGCAGWGCGGATGGWGCRAREAAQQGRLGQCLPRGWGAPPIRPVPLNPTQPNPTRLAPPPSKPAPPCTSPCRSNPPPPLHTGTTQRAPRWWPGPPRPGRSPPTSRCASTRTSSTCARETRPRARCTSWRRHAWPPSRVRARPTGVCCRRCCRCCCCCCCCCRFLPGA
jgi:hypothetical protein